MGKDNKQVIFLLVILLVAVVLLDVGRTRLSGQASDESITTVNEEDGLEGPSTVPSPQPQQPQKTIPPVQQFCETTDVTKIILSKIPGATKIAEFDDIQEKYKKYFVVVTTDATNIMRWDIYDIGSDGLISNDDRIYIGGLITQQPAAARVFIGLATSYGSSEKLFWVDAQPQSPKYDIMSCALPACNNRMVEATLTNNLIHGILPTGQRIYLGLINKISNQNSVSSCSLNPLSSDACQGSENNYRTDILYKYFQFGSLGSTALKDTGIAFYDNTFLNIQGSKPIIVTLPSQSLSYSMILLGPYGLVLRSINMTNFFGWDLIAVDLLSGNIITTFERIEGGRNAQPFLLSFTPTITTIYETPHPYQSYILKPLRANKKVIWNPPTPASLYGKLILSSGNMIAYGIISNNNPIISVISFDCTP
ncbi:hypothetical protein HYS50_01535 [Candidatus Woesearchaeota archaeon]|nr:hypothetical protein [Candidatus Woesearchaeota archaeon]